MAKYGKLFALLTIAALVLSAFAVGGCTAPATTTPPKTTETSTTPPPAPTYKLVFPGKLTVGSDLDFPPMEQLNGTTPEGFDVDIMKAIARELKLEINYLPPQNFDALIALVNGGKFDVIASSMTINDDRKKLIVFSDPMFESNQSIAMKAGSTYTAPADLKGKKVGVQSGTTGFDWANEFLKPAGATVVPFTKTSQAFAALEAGNVQAVVNDLPITNEIVKDASKGLVIVKQIPTGELYGLGVALDNADLATAMNAALKTIKASGEYKTIYEKWIGPMQ